MHKQFSLQTQILFYVDNCYFLYPKIHVRSLPVEIETLELKLTEGFKSNEGIYSQEIFKVSKNVLFFSTARFIQLVF